MFLCSGFLILSTIYLIYFNIFSRIYSKAKEAVSSNGWQGGDKPCKDRHESLGATICATGDSPQHRPSF